MKVYKAKPFTSSMVWVLRLRFRNKFDLIRDQDDRWAAVKWTINSSSVQGRCTLSHKKNCFKNDRHTVWFVMIRQHDGTTSIFLAGSIRYFQLLIDFWIWLLLRNWAVSKVFISIILASPWQWKILNP